MLKLIIFDLDGTLADTSQDITDALNHALKPFGVKEYSVEETKAMVGSGISKLLESLLPEEAIIPPDPPLKKGEITNAKEVVTGRFLDYYDNHLIDNTELYPQVRETLSQLDSYKKAVLSNKREKYSKEILHELGIMQFFDLVWGSDSVREKKPSPVPILDILDRFNVSKSEAVIIGDSNYDVEAGRAAGVKVIAVTYGFRSREFLEGSDYIIDRFDELLDVIPRIEDNLT
jgi:phosphoglycolate phosphatase